MALTPQRGALAQIQQQAQGSIWNVARTPQPAPAQNPAPSNWSAQQPRSNVQPSVQQIIQRAVAARQQPVQQYNQVNQVRNAVMTALAMAQGPGRGPV